MAAAIGPALGAAGRFIASNAISGAAAGVAGTATERLILEFREDGARVVKRSTEEIGEALDKTEQSAVSLDSALAGLAGVGIAASFLEIAQAATQIDNRLLLATGSVDGANRAFDRLFDVSTRTRSALEGNVDLFQKLSAAGAELGATQEELVGFVEASATAL